jgi:uncharacterized protein YndB with AHSA1/START domain
MQPMVALPLRTVIAPQIEREILIDAPVDVVWRVVTQPEEMDRWLSEKADVESRPGARGTIRMSARTTYNIVIEAVEPHRRFAFRWAHPDATRPDVSNSMLVEFTFHPEAGGTRLRVVESGFDRIDWDDEAKRTYFEGHNNGWPGLLTKLRDLLVSET